MGEDQITEGARVEGNAVYAMVAIEKNVHFEGTVQRTDKALVEFTSTINSRPTPGEVRIPGLFRFRKY